MFHGGKCGWNIFLWVILRTCIEPLVATNVEKLAFFQLQL